ncbi:membrane protein insertion efficiency factor YidD [Patescibacteria group bacterium]
MKYLILKTIKFYQKFISPYLGNNCRFYPSCSEYSFQSIKKYGISSGCQKGLKRILRCHPWNPGGIDLP